MNIKVSCGSLWRWSYFDIDIELTGCGKLKDPYIIKAKSTYDSKYFEIRISRSDKHLEIIGLNIKALYINNSKNVKITDTTVKHLGLRDSTDISIKNANITKEMRIVKCYEMKISKSQIKKLTAFSGDNLLFLDCDVNKISRKSNAKIKILPKQKLSEEVSI
ncbi:MAG: hypothetical protein ACXADW_18130 [Candidatus Hodarchaeales archaeon]|jgi:hypothetical protein